MKLLSPGMVALLVAQFFSALGDNAILIAAIAVVKAAGSANLVPFLQEAFVIPFILLAPFAGPLADSFPKRSVMFCANGFKLAGALSMALGLNPLIAYNLVGLGATAYSPAKYGILAQMFPAQQLVRANGMLEGSTITAILLGVLIGGWLADYSLSVAFAGVVTCYLIAAGANLLMLALPAERPVAAVRPLRLVIEFFLALAALFRNRDARFSLAGTSLFWGTGTTRRLLLFAWVPVALAITDNETPAILMGVVSIGIILGAAAAGTWISLGSVNRALPGGLLLGPLIMLLATVTGEGHAMVLLCIVGICGGMFIVPLNALLQERGHETVGAGRALAAQNFCENFAMLAFVGIYSLAVSFAVPITLTAAGFGGVVFAGTIAISAIRFAKRPENKQGSA